MSFRISNNSLMQKHYLEVDSSGLNFFYGTLSGARRFRFHEIDAVLLSSNHTLSFQVGNEVFTIPTKPDDADHRNVIDFLVQEVQRTLE